MRLPKTQTVAVSSFSKLRKTRLRLALVFGLSGKAGGLSLQIIAVPLIARTLGEERFAVFTLVQSILLFFSFAQLGLAPYLTQRSAALLVSNHHETIRGLLWTSASLVSAIGVSICILAVLLQQTFGLTWLWGETANRFGETLTWGYYFVCYVGFITVICSIFQGAQVGYQESHINAAITGVGSLVTAGALYFIKNNLNLTEQGFWAILYGIPLLGVISSAGSFILRHKDLSFSPSAIQIALIPGVLKAGLTIAVVQVLLPFLFREASRLYLLHSSTLQEVARYAVCLQLSGILGGILAIFTTPLYGSISDAWARNDREWISERLILLRVVCFVSGAAFIALLYLHGEELIKMWTGGAIRIPRETLVAFAVSFMIAALVHIHQVFLLGCGESRRLLKICTLEISVQLILVTTLRPETTLVLFLIFAISQVFTSLSMTSLALRSRGDK